MNVRCWCFNWHTGMAQIIKAQRLAEVHHDEKYTGETFAFCPWCGGLLKEDKKDLMSGKEVVDVLD